MQKHRKIGPVPLFEMRPVHVKFYAHFYSPVIQVNSAPYWGWSEGQIHGARSALFSARVFTCACSKDWQNGEQI